MNPQTEFDTALSGLTSQERATYTARNPTINVGGLNRSLSSSGGYEPVPANLLGTQPLKIPPINTNVPQISPTISAPAGTTMGENGGVAPTPVEEESAQSKAMKDFLELGKELKTKGDVTQKLQEEQQLASKTEQATKDYNAYSQAKLESQQRIENILNSQGGTKAGREEEARQVSRKDNANLSNLAVQAQASQGLLSAAEKSIQDKLDAQFKPIQEQIDYYSKFIELNNNDLTEKQKFDLEQQASNKEKELSTVQNTTSAIQKTLLENGAPASSYAELDKISDDYIDGKITASEAQSKMFSSVGQYGVPASVVKQRIEIKKLNEEIANASKVDISAGNPAINAISTLSYTLPENARKSLVKSMADSLERGDVAAVDRTLRNTAKNFAGSALSTEITKRDIAIESVRDLKSALVEYKNAGGETSWLKGGYEDLARKTGRSTDKKLAALQTKITLAVASYRNAVSGAAFTEQEQKEYMSTFPAKNNKFELNETIADTLIDTFDKNNAAFYTSYYGDTPTNIAKNAVYEQLLQDATPEQRAQLGQ